MSLTPPTGFEDTLPFFEELSQGWHDSSFDLRRGLTVIELDIDPAITHGVAAKLPHSHTAHGVAHGAHRGEAGKPAT